MMARSIKDVCFMEDYERRKVEELYLDSLLLCSMDDLETKKYNSF